MTLISKATFHACIIKHHPILAISPHPFPNGLGMLCGVALVCAQGILDPRHSQVSVYSDQGCITNGGSRLVAVLDGAKLFFLRKKNP